MPLSGGSAFRLLADGGAFGVDRLTLDVGADGAKPHFHAPSSELFYVLDGVLEFRHGGRPRWRAAGWSSSPWRAARVRRGTGPPADVLVVLTPGVERFGYFRRPGRIARGLDAVDALRSEQDRYDVTSPGDGAGTPSGDGVPAARQAFGSNGMPLGFARARLWLNAPSLMARLALPKFAFTRMSRMPVGKRSQLTRSGYCHVP